MATNHLCYPCQITNKTAHAEYICFECEEKLCMKCVNRHARRKATAHHKPVFKAQPVYTDIRKAGRPRISNVSSDEMTLVWDSPSIELGKDDYYQICFKEIDHDKRWRYFKDEYTKPEAVIKGLKSNTSYVFRVRAVYEEGEGPYSIESVIVTTCQSQAFRIANMMNNPVKVDKSPDILPVPITKKSSEDTEKIRGFFIGDPNAGNNREKKTILLVGATGSGKSTLVDGFINYIMEVNWNDPFRFTVKDVTVQEKLNKAFSQEDWITSYTIYPEKGSRLQYQLQIIDTPGFGDTRGVERDQEMIQQIQTLFSENGTNSLTHIDAICFVLKAPDARLTLLQKYIFQLVMSIFGNDVKNHICSLITFADGKDPPVLAGMKESGLPFGCTFLFNNCSLYVHNEEINESSLSQVFWKISIVGFRSFFAHLDSSISCSLDRTREVLQARGRIDLILKQIQPKIDNGLIKTGCLREEQREMAEMRKKAESYKDFEIHETEVQQRKRDLPRGQHVTNCLHCNISCHVNCNCPLEDKSKCRVMNCNGYCTICPNKCHWKQHCNTPHIFENIQVKVKKILHEKRQKYIEHNEKIKSKENFVEKLKEEIRQLFSNANTLNDQLQACTNKLAEIALQVNPSLDFTDHIDVLLENEKLGGKEGFLKRISMMKEIKKRAELSKYFNQFREDVRKLN